MGKITSDDVKPILEKFKRLTGENSNKITSSDVSGPMRKKKNDTSCSETEEGKDQENTENDDDNITSSSSKSSASGALVVGKKIAIAFREELLSSGSVVSNPDHQNHVGNVDFKEEEKNKEDQTKKSKREEHSDFRIPKNTYAIAIDDSKIQRKLLGKIFDNAGITEDRRTICGNGYDEIMGFEDFTVAFMENHDGYVFMIGV